MEARHIEAFLEYQIAAIDAAMAALQPKWEVAPLAQSYADGQALEAVIDVWDGELLALHAAREQALADHAYGERKLQQYYI